MNQETADESNSEKKSLISGPCDKKARFWEVAFNRQDTASRRQERAKYRTSYAVRSAFLATVIPLGQSRQD